jgi:Novel STAND NTPase 1
VAIDQAEELLLRSGPTEQRAFLELLRGAPDADGPLWAVATVRSEYFSTSPERVGLAEAIDDTLVIEPLSRAQLGEVIGRPARRSGLEFDPGLIERMIEDTAGGDAVPLLAYTLRELAGRATSTGRISTQSYTALGGVVGALRGRADQVAGELDRLGHGRLVMPTLIQLAAVSGDDEPTRRRVRRSTLNPEEQTIVDAFIDASLLVSDHNPATLDGEPTVEVAHEALLRQWEPLRRAIEADRATLRLRSELERLAADWQEAGNDESYLLRGGRLDTFEQWRNHDDDDQLAPTEQRFLTASRSLANRDVEKTRRSNRRLRMLAGGLAALLIAALLTE